MLLSAGGFGHLENVETNCFAEWSAFANSDGIANGGISVIKTNKNQEKGLEIWEQGKRIQKWRIKIKIEEKKEESDYTERFPHGFALWF